LYDSYLINTVYTNRQARVIDVVFSSEEEYI